MPKAAALSRLRRTLESIRSGSDQELVDIAEARDEVMDHYRPIFDRSTLAQLTANQFKSFLFFKNNRHWKSIHRQANQIVSDMDGLRAALGVLLDEGRPLTDRLRELRPKNRDPLVKGLARSVITPILLIAHPEKYGVLNQVAESAMLDLGIWPQLERGADFADKYSAVNAILLDLARELETDLWTLDALWWGVAPEEEAGSEEFETDRTLPDTDEQIFGLELHLHDFLRDNWDQTELGCDWALLEEDGEVIGYKYNTREVGEIDLLARHRTDQRWLVVELKRGRTSDQAVGQALRYRGWVRRKLASPDEPVEAIVIGHAADPKLMYALDGVEGVSALTYSVRFTVREPDAPWGDSVDGQSTDVN